MYNFRVEFHLPLISKITFKDSDTNESKIELEDGKELEFSYKETENGNILYLSSKGWDSEDEAIQQSEKIIDSILLALSHYAMSPKFGVRTKDEENELGSIVAPGVNIFKENEKASATAIAYPITWNRSIRFETLHTLFEKAKKLDHSFSDKERVALDIYSRALNVRFKEEACFILFFNAIEILIDNNKRHKEITDHVEKFIDMTKELDFDGHEDESILLEEKRSLLGSLDWLKNHSIRQSGIKMVSERLGEKEYSGRKCVDLFKECYNVRNRLVHGNEPFPTPEEIQAINAPLELMLGDLFAYKLID